MPKAQRTRGLSSYQSSNTNLDQIYLQNLDQASISKSQPKISLSTKFKLQNLDQTKRSTSTCLENLLIPTLFSFHESSIIFSVLLFQVAWSPHPSCGARSRSFKLVLDVPNVLVPPLTVTQSFSNPENCYDINRQ